DVDDLLMVVLHQAWAVTQRVELARVGDGGFAGRVPVRVIELGGPANAGALLGDRLNFAKTATSERAHDDVLARHASAGRKVESSSLFARPVHLGASSFPRPNRSSNQTF